MEIINVNEQNFEKEVLQSERPVLVDVWAQWCGPCKMIGPIVEQIAQEQSELKVVKVDADEAAAIAEKYQVTSIPTLLVFNKGEEINRSVGLIGKEQILQLIHK